jgi:hypothetical protein
MILGSRDNGDFCITESPYDLFGDGSSGDFQNWRLGRVEGMESNADAGRGGTDGSNGMPRWTLVRAAMEGSDDNTQAR